MNVEWVAIRSWHIVRTPTRAPRTYQTLCGRLARDTEVHDIRPAGRTCESCVRWLARKVDG